MSLNITKKDLINKYQETGKKNAIKWLVGVYLSVANRRSTENLADKVITRYQKLLKNKDEKEIDNFLKENLEPPKKLDPVPIRKPHSKAEYCEHETLCTVLQKELNEVKLELQKIKQESSIKSKEKVLVKENKKLIKKTEFFETKYAERKKELKRSLSREDYYRKKVQKLEQCLSENKGNDNRVEAQQESEKDTTEQVEKDIDDLFENLKSLNDENHYLRSLVEEQDDYIYTCNEGDRYTDDLKKCVYSLLSLNVSMSKVSDVISTVLQLAGKKASKLPSYSTVQRMNLQRLSLCHKQLAEVFSAKEDTTLMTDETSKLGSKYMGYEAADKEGNLWVLGLRDIETKSAENTLKVFKDILSDIDDLSSQSVSKDILKHIVNTMSDRAATEIKFNEMLCEYRKDILPVVVANYEHFDNDEKASLGSMYNFFCGLHALVNMAATAQSSVSEVEKGLFPDAAPIYDKSFYKSSEPGAYRLIRTACKAFARGADEKSGCHVQFLTYTSNYLKENKFQSLPLKPYRGSRFNILFENAASVYFLYKHMLSFLGSYGAQNNLLRAVLCDLKVDEYIAGVKALGLISLFVTSPLWYLFERKDVSMLDMNVHYSSLVNFFKIACEDENMSRFMLGELLPFDNFTYVKKDPIFESLIETSDIDGLVKSELLVIFPALHQLCSRLFKDHLKDGKFHNVTTEMIEKCRSVPKTSQFAESVFGTLDQLMRSKPNISTLASEAYIMFSNNHTMAWLDAKSEAEKKKLIKKASRDTKKIQKSFVDRKKEIENNMKAALQAQIEKKEKLEQKRIQQQEEYTNRIIHHGLWQSIIEVDNMLKSYTSPHFQINALKAQISFRKEVLHQKPSEKSLFNFSKKDGSKRVKLTIDELTSNLKIIIGETLVQETEQNTQHILVGKRVRHRFETDGVMKWYTGKVVSQVPAFPDWFNIIYDEDDAVYTYHHIDVDRETGNLQILVE